MKNKLRDWFKTFLKILFISSKNFKAALLRPYLVINRLRLFFRGMGHQKNIDYTNKKALFPIFHRNDHGKIF